MLKPSVFLFFSLLLSSSVFGQDTTRISADSIIIDSGMIRVGNIVIINKGNRLRIDSSFTIHLGKSKSKKRANISNNFLFMDLGFNNLVDITDYSASSVTGATGYFPNGTESMLDLNNGKSLNVNLWFFMQRVNLIKHVVNLKYGLGIEMNNFRYRNNIRYRFEPRDFIERDADIANFEKNKLVAQYVTLPVMLHFNFNQKKGKPLGFSAGMSAGYLYASRQKLVSEARGKEKIKNDFNLSQWRLSAIGELNLSPVIVYGSYALTPLLRNGLEQNPYSVGLRFDIDIDTDAD